ncbi:hypothetical protein E1281_25670 [Actinomadura sp. KC345]|uniref:HEAT repeat domain-containing protein n=1 Tax=Actinomadura sp. KC345 TaxID=2530371 RepID=UPI00104D5488|nr:HEAT repeat domain-containing protein [Actinomadura sp. KC345]TDC47808.1 hypothetical protein E1281_25670 [Actinomadura sp. KC345]
MTPLRGLDRIDWTALRHAYGSAGDVPGLLRGIAEGPDPGDALDDLDVKIFHQGGFVCSAATAALPYLTAMAASPAIAVRPGVLELIGRLVHEANTPSRHDDRSHVDGDWPGAWAAALPGVLALLADPDVAVRRELTSTLSAAIGDADSVVPALRARWAAESDRAVRIGIVLAAGELAGGCTAGVLPEALGWLRDLRGHQDAQIRAAAEIALAEAVAAQRPDLGVLVDAVSGDVAVWRDVPWVGAASPDLAEFYGGGASRLLGWFDTRLTGATGSTNVTGRTGGSSAHGVAARTELAATFIGAGDADRRIGAARIAAGLLSAWRSPARTLLPALAERATDPSSAVRAYATHLLAALDEGDADLLAARLDDTAPLAHDGRERIADLAAWGLARRRDPRCLPYLVDRLGGDVSVVDVVSGPSGPFGTSPPSMRHVLAPLGGYADTLLPPIRARLGEPGMAAGFADVLEQWGPAAAPAVPELIRLLDTDAAVRAARAIAAIGPPAEAAAPPLSAPRASGDRRSSVVLPWALWKVIGDPDPLLAVTETLIEDRGAAGLLGYVADLGPLAAHHAARLRPLLDVRDDWTRVEAAHAYYAVTGDAEAASAALAREIHELAAGRYRPVRWAAARHLTEIRSGYPGLQTAARAILASDRRHHWATGWRAFAEDQELRDLASRLAGVAGP